MKNDKKNMKFFNVKADSFVMSHSVSEAKSAINTHTHDFIELIYIISADASYYTEDKEYKLKEGDLIITPPATHHRLEFRGDTPYERFCISINPSLVKGIDVKSIYKNIQVINCAGRRTISDIFLKFDYYRKAFDDKECKELMRMLIIEIFYNLTIYENENRAEPSFLSPILSKAIGYINENLFEIESISEISKSLYITDSYLFEIFKNQLKTSPKKYIISKRLHAARKEIALGAKPTEIYQKAGFKDYTSFNRNYTKFFGHPPSHEKYYFFSEENIYF